VHKATMKYRIYHVYMLHWPCSKGRKRPAAIVTCRLTRMSEQPVTGARHWRRLLLLATQAMTLRTRERGAAAECTSCVWYLAADGTACCTVAGACAALQLHRLRCSSRCTDRLQR
jgi:hypothetical protein